MKQRTTFLKVKYSLKIVLYISFIVIVMNIAMTLGAYRNFYLAFILIILAIALLYDYLKYQIEYVMIMLAEANNVDDIQNQINIIKKRDLFKGVENSLILPQLFLYLDQNKPQSALDYLEEHQKFLKSKLDYLLIYRTIHFKVHVMLNQHDQAIIAYQKLIKLKDTNLKNKKMKLLFNWDQIEALYNFELKKYKRSRNLYNRIDITHFNKREMLHYYYEQKILSIKSNDKQLFLSLSEKMSSINRQSPLNIEWRSHETISKQN